LGVLVFRLASYTLMVLLAVAVDLRAPWATAVLLVAVGAWIGLVTRAGAWGRPWARWIDLGISAALLVVGPFLQSEGALMRQPFFAAAYPLSTVMTWAGARGVVGGLGAAIALSIPLALSRWLNGTSFGDPAFDLDGTLSIATGTSYYLLAGVVVGLFTQTLDRAARTLRLANESASLEREHAARLREREVLARTIHDSVLQSLTVVHRRGQELAGRDRIDPRDVAELVGLVDGQERELRTLLRGIPAAPPPGTVPLRTVLEAGAFGVAGVEISVSTIEPAWVPASAAAEVSAAVRAALDNVMQHAAATQATVFGETVFGEAGGDELVVSIRDDGVGFDVDALGAVEGRFGIARSIRGRIEDLGGLVGIRSGPGRGTEVEIRLPLPEGSS
jgi:signal transduction histidine kinase